jgi:predicted AlkP superfamily pyrophosphatase or phosphodiesterase
MKKTVDYLYVISFDGLSTLDLDYIMTLPNFQEFMHKASYARKVYSVYPTLTYPAHATIVTGRYPKNHGIINNTLLQPNRQSPDWYWQRKYIKGETIFDLAIEKGMKVAALLWPVTAKSRIQYNMPEIFANRSWHNQILVSLLNGSPLFQISLNQKFGYLRKGLKQPHLDNFTHQSLLHTIKHKQPELTLVHYTDLDTMRHHHGFNSQEAREALERNDQRLGEIIRTLQEANIYEESTLIVLGDHSSLDEDTIISPNVLLKQKGYIDVDAKGRIINYRAIVKSCDGSAYVYTKPKRDKQLTGEIRQLLEEFNQAYNCLETIYSNAEAVSLGADPECSLMLEANRGYYFSDDIEGESMSLVKPEHVGVVPHHTKAAHGYSPFKDNYTTVFMAAGKGIKQGVVVNEMNLVDEGPTIARLLRVNLPDTDGRVLEEILE